MKILAVCLGNICRSPLAEGLLQREVDTRGLDWEIASGGTAGYHTGNPPDPRSIAVARKHGLDISKQVSHKVSLQDLDYYDLILAMDRQNYRDLENLAHTPEQRQKLQLLLDYTELSDKVGPDVFDPYWDDSGFEGVYLLLQRAMQRVVERLV
ncbi:MAG: low molecular weight protein-tyrosine-phosphatase [Bacteroidota bacterium]